jgi:hypothetical protein
VDKFKDQRYYYSLYKDAMTYYDTYKTDFLKPYEINKTEKPSIYKSISSEKVF